MKIAIASNNKGKIAEIERIFQENHLQNIEFVCPSSLNIISNPEETADSLKGNSLIKAVALFELSGIPTIADDTGLFVEALDGNPGVHSARYAGENSTDKQNREKLLQELKDSKKRNAYFETVICYFDGKKEKSFSGKCFGTITLKEIGENGFGYDSIFTPNGFNKTFAELDSKIKSEISHRYLATIKFIKWLKKNN